MSIPAQKTPDRIDVIDKQIDAEKESAKFCLGRIETLIQEVHEKGLWRRDFDSFEAWGKVRHKIRRAQLLRIVQTEKVLQDLIEYLVSKSDEIDDGDAENQEMSSTARHSVREKVSQRAVLEAIKGPKGKQTEILASAIYQANGRPVTPKHVQKVKAHRADGPKERNGQPDGPAEPPPPFADFVDSVEAILSKFVTLTRELGNVLGFDSQTKVTSNPYARQIRFETTLGAIVQIIRNVQSSLPPFDKPGVIADSDGNPIPDVPLVRDAFAARPAFADLAYSISQNKTRAIALSDTPAGSRIQRQQIEADATNFRREILAAQPHGVCPYCAGGGDKSCRACKGAGWLPKSNYEQSPANLRAKLKKAKGE